MVLSCSKAFSILSLGILLMSFLLGRHELRPEAGATQERTLQGSRSMPVG
jgi:hypothetical protein